MNKVLPYTLYRISSFFYKEKKHLYYPNNYAKRITILGGAICERLPSIHIQQGSRSHQWNRGDDKGGVWLSSPTLNLYYSCCHQLNPNREDTAGVNFAHSSRILWVR
ncbi:uncharacterized protein LOC143253738 isoform X1 [Tachypleus tridentatus]|uniref:uncharacterized protein LOC143253738 isoform X1 n=1 Tax=Tachypleus tridentatus TaxID=6853 RepID=UPI003FD1FBF1